MGDDTREEALVYFLSIVHTELLPQGGLSGHWARADVALGISCLLFNVDLGLSSAASRRGVPKWIDAFRLLQGSSLLTRRAVGILP